MACEICGRGSCTRSFHSISEQERFDRGECEECTEAQEEITRLRAKVEELRDALTTITRYDNGDGCCPYGCDTSHIAAAALNEARKGENET